MLYKTGLRLQVTVDHRHLCMIPACNVSLEHLELIILGSNLATVAVGHDGNFLWTSEHHVHTGARDGGLHK